MIGVHLGASARRGRDGTRTRARIEEEALRLFAARGVAGTSVRDIAEAVGVSEGALYRHFGSKEELARDLFLSRYAALARDICRIAEDSGSFDEKIQMVVDSACRLFDETPELFAYLLLSQHDHLAQVPEEAGANVVEAIAGLLRAGGVAAGDADLAAALALGCVVQPASFVLYGRLPGPLATYREAITRAAMRIIAGFRTA